MNFNRIIRKIAKQQGVSPKEIKTDMQEAVKFSMYSTDKTAKEFWKNFYSKHKKPTVANFITEIADIVKNDLNG